MKYLKNPTPIIVSHFSHVNQYVSFILFGTAFLTLWTVNKTVDRIAKMRNV